MISSIIIELLLCIIFTATVNCIFCNEDYGDGKRHITKATSTVNLETNEEWRSIAIAKLWNERKRMQYTPLIKYTHPSIANTTIYFKNEADSLTGSLKHRYAWALFLWALIEGHINPDTTVYEVSSGNTAASEAYMARLIGVKFVAVVSAQTESSKLEIIRFFGGDVHLTNSCWITTAKEIIRKQPNTAFFMNQFANGEQAADYSESGTLSSICRYSRRYNLNVSCIFADSEFSTYYDWVANGYFGGNETVKDILPIAPAISGIGAGVLGALNFGVTTSLNRNLISKAIKLPDLASIAAMFVLRDDLNISGGPSSGVNFLAALHIAAAECKTKSNSKHAISIATLVNDGGDRYSNTFYQEWWIEQNYANRGGITLFRCYKQKIRNALYGGFDPLQTIRQCTESLLSFTNHSHRKTFNNYTTSCIVK